MKKLLFLLLLINSNAHAANFIDTLAGECGKILYEVESHKYPDRYDNIKPRNSQFWALKKCLEIYKDNGGNMEELNKRYEKVMVLKSKLDTYCLLSEKQCSDGIGDLLTLSAEELDKLTAETDKKLNQLSIK